MISDTAYLYLSYWLHRKAVLASDLFDIEWYKLAHPYVVRDHVDPVYHFMMYGKRLRLTPSRNFDTNRYLDEYEQARNSRLNPLVHYLKLGRSLDLDIHPAPPSEADRIINSGLFDENWYYKEYPDVAAANFPALLHFMLHGAAEGRSPGPKFDSDWYFTQYPDTVGINPLIHYINYGRKEGRMPLPPQKIYATMKATIASIIDLDPALYSSDLFDKNKISVTDCHIQNRISHDLELIVKSIKTPPRAIVILPWLINSGADLVACHAIQMLAEKHGSESVLVILADHDRQEAMQLLPPAVQLLSFSRIDKFLSTNERIELLDLLIRNLQPETVLNVNSHIAWEATKRLGQRLKKFTRLYAMLFCPDYGPTGKRDGYADLYLRDCLPHLEGIYFDNQTFIDELIEQFTIPTELQSRLVLLYQPAPDIKLERKKRAVGQTLQVLWAGRIVPQKNIDLLIQIAETAPQFEFHIWGSGSHALEGRLYNLSERCPNVHYNGSYERFDALPLENYDSLLYTSLWDGIPNVLLEAASAGLPIVASNAGGISELLDETTGWLVSELKKAEPYVSALQAISNNPELAAKHVDAMQKRINGRHNWPSYRKTLTQSPSTTGGILRDASQNHSSS